MISSYNSKSVIWLLSFFILKAGVLYSHPTNLGDVREFEGTHMVSPQITKWRPGFFLYQNVDYNSLSPDKAIAKLKKFFEDEANGCTFVEVSRVFDQHSGLLSVNFDLYLGLHKIEEKYLNLHFRKNQAFFIRANLPTDCFYDFSETTFEDKKINPYLNTDELFETNREVVLLEHYGQLRPCLKIEYSDKASGSYRTLFFDLENEELLKEEEVSFNTFGNVFPNGNTSSLKLEPLVDLLDSDFLDGIYFSVFSPKESDERARKQKNQFFYQPEDQFLFDQVQSYYNATKVLNWFESYFSYERDRSGLTIRVNSNSHSANTAVYLPRGESGKSEIWLGSGDGIGYINLSRDIEVISHEFSHHIIYNYLKETSGESGAIHEGTADYFTYAMTENPNLGETIVPGSPYLRTAEVDWRYDNPSFSNNVHVKGQIWSSVLWSIRKRIGKSFDKTVFKSLSFLAPNSGFKDMFLALINADLLLNPRVKSDPEFHLFGKGNCIIFEEGIRKGFAQFLEEYNGSSCGFDLKALAEESRLLSESQNEKRRGKKIRVDIFGHSCGIGANTTTNNNILLWIIILFPLLVQIPLGRRKWS